MGTDWAWNSDKRPVAMTEDVAKMLVREIVTEITQAKQSDLLEQFKQFAKVEIELAQARADLQRNAEKAREESDRKDAEILALRAHIDTLNSMFARLTPAAAGVQYSPYNNNGSNVMTHPIPMPPLPVPVPSAPPFQSYQSYAVVPEPPTS